MGLFACVGLLFAGIGIASIVDGPSAPQYPSQTWFLNRCAEDEVIGMDAKFGADAVGCLHREGNTIEP